MVGCLGFGSPGRSGFDDKIRVIRLENTPMSLLGGWGGIALVGRTVMAHAFAPLAHCVRSAGTQHDHVPGPGSGTGETDMQETGTVPVFMGMKFQPGKCH